MMKKTHVTIGVTLTTLAANAVNIPITGTFLLTAAFATVFSDLDHPRSYLNSKLLVHKSKFFKILTYLLMAALLIQYGSKYFDKYILIYASIIIVTIGFSHHRGITHSIPGVLGMGIILYMIKRQYGLDLIFPFTVGMMTHIFLDMLNPTGVGLFTPFNKKRIKIPGVNIDTNSTTEYLLCLTFLLALGWITYKNIFIP